MSTDKNKEKTAPDATLESRVQALEDIISTQDETITELKNELEKRAKQPAAPPAPKKATIPEATFTVDKKKYCFKVPRFNFKFEAVRKDYVASEVLENQELLEALVKGKHTSIFELVK